MPTAIKQVVILAGGRSSRFEPYTHHHSKLATDLMGQPLIAWTLDSLRQTSVEQVVIVTPATASRLKKAISTYQQAYPDFSINTVDQVQAKGMADAILTAFNLLEESFVVVNGSHFDVHYLLEKIAQLDTPVSLLSKTTANPHLYGVLEVEGGIAQSLVEKPQQHSVPAQRVVACYRLSKKFAVYLQKLQAEEYLLETALNNWMQDNSVQVARLEKTTPSLKYPWHLLSLKDQLLPKISHHIAASAHIADSALITGQVYIGREAIVGERAVIAGPAYVGEKAVVGRFCTLRNRSVLEAGAEFQSYGDVRNSILLKDSSVHGGFIGDSVIGEKAKIGAGFISANRRLDRGEIKTMIKGQPVNTHLTRLGAIIGHQASLGVRVSTMPGVIIDNQAVVNPGKIVSKNFTTN